MNTNARIKTILCYGDSNTWAFNPFVEQTRYAYEDRWTTILARTLGPSYHVIAEGLNGRTTVFDDPTVPGRNGADYLYPCLQSHKPLNMVLIMLGTNDSAYRYSATAMDIAAGMKRLVKIVKYSEAGSDNGAPLVGIIAPPPVNQAVAQEVPGRSRYHITAELAQAYRTVALEMGVYYFNAGSYIDCPMPDGVHLHPEGHKVLGEQIGTWLTTTCFNTSRHG